MTPEHINVSLAEATLGQLWNEIKARSSASVLATMYNEGEDFCLFTDGRFIEVCGLIEVIKERQKHLRKQLHELIEDEEEE